MTELTGKYDTLIEFPVIDFDRYRTYCDERKEFRKIGLQDEIGYQDALRDPTTQFVEIDGQSVPILANIKHEKMYHEKRCQEMCECSNVMLLCLPLESLVGLEEKIDIDISTAVLVEEFAENTDFEVRSPRLVPGVFGENYEIIDFSNPQLAGTPHETAWMGAYDFTFGQNVEVVKPFSGESLTDEVASIWQSYALNELGHPPLPQLETQNNEGTFLLTPEQLADRKDIADALWEISEIGFGEVLGAHHPVSMQFNRGFFDQQMVEPNTLTAIHYVDNQPVCFGFISLDMEHNPWLNDRSEMIQAGVMRAQEMQRPYIHFHELISSGVVGMGYSTNILNTFLNVAKRMNYDFSVFFESTNLSSLYIPKIIEKEIQETDGIAIKEDIKMRGKLEYWAFRKNQSSI